MTPARFRWGMILIQIGLLLLLMQLEVFSEDLWVALLLWSPVLLIAIGVEKIFTKTKLQIISYLTSVAVFVAGMGIAYSATLNAPSGSGFLSDMTLRESFDGTVNRIRATIDMGNTDLTIRDSGDDLIYGHFDRFTRKPKFEFNRADSVAQIKLSSRDGRFMGGAVEINVDEPQDWYLAFSGALPLDLACVGENADIHLNMATTPLENLDIDAMASQVYVKLGDRRPFVKATIRGADSKIRLRVPYTLGVKVFGDDYSVYLEKLGLVESEPGVYMTSGFDTLASQAELHLEDDFSSFSIDFF